MSDDLVRALLGTWETLDDIPKPARDALLADDELRIQAARASLPGDGEQTVLDRVRYFNLTPEQALQIP